jgi:hypothetical protein
VTKSVTDVESYIVNISNRLSHNGSRCTISDSTSVTDLVTMALGVLYKIQHR